MFDDMTRTLAVVALLACLAVAAFGMNKSSEGPGKWPPRTGVAKGL